MKRRTERKNIKRNATRKPAELRPLNQGAGMGGRWYTPRDNMTSYEIKLLHMGLY